VQGADQYEGQPKIATVMPNSAAQKAGILVGDVVKTIDGKPVASQAQMLHQLGSKYEGDVISVTLDRGGKEIVLDKVALGGTATANAPPFLGILPVRDDPRSGQEVRFVYPKSPAEAAGIKPGDRITKIGVVAIPLQAFSGRDQLAARLATLAPGTDVKLEIARKDGGKSETVTAKLDTLPSAVPDKLSGNATAKKALAPREGVKGAAKEKKEEPKKDAKPETGLLKRRNAADDHDYFVYVPENYDPNISHALLLWLHPVGKGRDQDFKDFALTWKDLCAYNHMILVMPRAENENGWVSSESDAVIQALREVMGVYTVDGQRVVAHGMGIGGQMAFYLGFSARDLVRGVAVTGSVLASPLKEVVPNQRLQFFLVAGGKDPLAKDIKESADKLSAGKYAVTYREIADMGHQYLDAATLEELARWLDSLDRQ
jgi:predicted esterase